jgi:hypothetical protein
MPEQRINADLRQQVAERADGSCECCRSQARYASQPFSMGSALLTLLARFEYTIIHARKQIHIQNRMQFAFLLP